MNTITMSTVRLTADSDAHVTVKHVTVIHVTIVVYVDNSARTVSTCNARLLTVYCTRILWQYTISMQCVEKTDETL